MAKRKPYNDVAERVLAAVRELNGALGEAHEHPQTRVQIAQHGIGPLQFDCEVTRITKHTVAFSDDEIKPWQFTHKIAEKTAAPKKATKAMKSSAKKAKKSRARKAA